MSKEKAQEGNAQLATVLTLATDTAKGELGATAANKRVCTTASVKTAVTENGKVKTTSVESGVTLSVATSEEDVAVEEGCCK